MISNRPTGDAKSCSIEPRSHSPATASAVSSTAPMAMRYAVIPGTRKTAERASGL